MQSLPAKDGLDVAIEAALRLVDSRAWGRSRARPRTLISFSAFFLGAQRHLEALVVGDVVVVAPLVDAHLLAHEVDRAGGRAGPRRPRPSAAGRSRSPLRGRAPRPR